MKKTLLLVLFSAVFQCVMAQDATFTITGKGPAFSSKSSFHFMTIYLGNSNNNYYFIQQPSLEPKTAAKKKEETKYTYPIIRYGSDMSVLAKNEMELTEDAAPMGGYVNDNNVAIMIQESHDNVTRLYRRLFDLKTMVPLGEPTLLKTIDLNSNSKHSSTLRESADGELLAYVDFIQGKNGNIEAQVALYDTELEPFWMMDSPISVFDNMFVSDSGEVILGGFTQEKGSKETHFELVYLDGDKMQTHSFDRELGKIRSMDIVRVENDRITLSGMVQDPAKEDSRQTNISKIYVLTYNMKYHRIENSTFHTISHFESNRILNKADKYKTRQDIVEYCDFFASTADDHGTTIAYRQHYNLSVNGIPSYTLFGGILVMRIDNNGNILWTAPIRYLSQQNYFYNIHSRGKMVDLGDRVAIIIDDAADNDKRDPAKTYASYNAFYSNPSMVLYLINRDGTIDRQHYPMPKKSVILGKPHHLQGNDYMMVLTSMSKDSYFTTLSIK